MISNSGGDHEMLIPQKWRKRTGVDTHEFLVHKPWGARFVYATHRDGYYCEVDPSAYCELMVDGIRVRTLVRERLMPAEFEAIGQMCQMMGTGLRLERILSLHKAYECVAEQPDISLSAIRHALTHPAYAITRPKTVAALVAIFGTTEVNLDNSRHNRLFYDVFAKLLKETDRLLGERIRQRLSETYCVPEGVKLYRAGAGKIEDGLLIIDCPYRGRRVFVPFEEVREELRAAKAA